MTRFADGVEPRDAATMVIVDDSGPAPKLLLGKRRSTQAFAPGKYVFPGGGVDAGDLELVPTVLLHDHDRAPLLHALRPASKGVTPEALALAAIRETFEESGLVFGTAADATRQDPPQAWRPFFAHGVVPDLGALTFIARAITPPGRPRRFDARFFLAAAASISLRLPANDGEFEELLWPTFAEARGLGLHSMTREIVAEVEQVLALPVQERLRRPIPFYYQHQSRWTHELIARPGRA